MKFLALVVLAVAAVIPAQACKCIDIGGSQDVGNTQSCCAALNGSFQDGNDCAADSISERLSNFRSCCVSLGSETSDCNFP
ncbi:uncharacterized protein BXZ73DRAFT_46018 [Epithele typhae]|uniref:uncharacterized protein n=1 Tax=Epithele typhae TaxID=378194 RepID=UPI002007CC5E|nr:uncharacterized protein BXZ73DRAFT_46018 [Epithele typhae]KAH9934079.1 hypothetical protein BXZ73DRAFT_46018 [Epithele typhae]